LYGANLSVNAPLTAINSTISLNGSGVVSDGACHACGNCVHLHKHGQQQHARGGGQTRPRSHNLRDDDLVLHGVQGAACGGERRQHDEE
jgi:hypothetical protein